MTKSHSALFAITEANAVSTLRSQRFICKDFFLKARYQRLIANVSRSFQ
jgi:hypothetical protein